MADPTDRAREEFFSEAQEIVETLARTLLALDAAEKSGSHDPALVNEAFRAVHTLKGLSGLFSAARLGALAHRLEDLLDDLRLGRAPLDARALDLLFRAVDAFGQLLALEKVQDESPAPLAERLLAELGRLVSAMPEGPGPLGEYDLDPGMLAVLTEYEEHRLKTNVESGHSLFRVRVAFDLATIDRALEDMKQRAKKHGEIITYLPTGEATSPDVIELDLLMASRDELATLVVSLGGNGVQIEELPRRKSRPAPRGTLPPQAAAAPPAASSLPAPAPGAELSHVPDAALVGAGDATHTLKSVTQTVRVDIRKLDLLMNVVGELAIVRGALARIAERLRGEGQRQVASELARLHRSFDRRLAEMQAGILEVRMVPLGQVFDRLARVVRQISRELGKEIRLVITGAETEIDKLIVEELSDPLMHMIRNAIDHGIEAAEVRQSVGKPAAGTIALNAFQKGDHVLIEVEDDGAGIDERTLLSRAVRMGLIQEGDLGTLSRSEVLGLVFQPGLSTRSEASDLSGRGVGMDVVKTNIARLGGVIDVQSEPGIGTKLTVTLPITLAIVSALMLRVGDETFALPLAAVSEAVAFDPRAVRTVEGREVVTLRGSTLPIVRLDTLLGIARAESARRRFVVVVSIGSRRLGLVVDHLIGQQDIVIKPLGRSLARVRGFAGATELGDQRVGLVLDAAGLVEEVLSSTEASRGMGVIRG